MVMATVVDPRTAGVVRGTKRRSKHFPRDSDRISNFRGDMKSYSNTGENLTLFAYTRDGENMLFRRDGSQFIDAFRYASVEEYSVKLVT